MHGLIFAEVKKYVTTKLGDGAWNALVEKAHQEPGLYLALQTYPDEKMVELLTTASGITGLSVAAILEDFGSFIIPDLIGMYEALIQPEWRTLDFIEHTEESIHSVVRIKQHGAEPPVLQCQRVSPTELILTYRSRRRLCALAKGMAQGLATHYGEQLTVAERTCMHRGDACCTIAFTVPAPVVAPRLATAVGATA
jgi:hypothetical protein